MKKERPALYVPNPSCGGRKPVELISDRAKRYRANSPDCRPDGPQVCMICASAAGDVMHLDGNESNLNPDNLAWGCRSCNTRLGKLFSKLGKGVKTRQYNPGGGAQSLGAWLSAINIAKYGAAGDLAAAVQTIRDTPAADRARYQAQAWSARKRMYGRSGRSGGSEVPF